ncbi:hypothetical protein AVEN_75606-1 [Araneus ventricosus]|uniref:Uncharacterized protein n=1 Tax=Araneus ventricosus TaxID=182803 RepID=A0A4Y2CL38_ARAVE|nr:hypothetical protein AVEN_75606-1 [Araneus ventricosus]
MKSLISLWPQISLFCLREFESLQVLGRLRPGVTEEDILTEITDEMENDDKEDDDDDTDPSQSLFTSLGQL